MRADRIDLHLHSCHSDDGELTPTALVALCLEAGVTVAAVADHNTVDGVAEAVAAGEAAGVRIIPAIELDCEAPGAHVHLLGYGIDIQAPVWARITADVRAKEIATASRLVEGARSLGLRVDDAALAGKAIRGVITVEMIADVALAEPANDASEVLAPYRAGGARSDNPYVNVYWDFYAPGKPLHVPVAYMSLREAQDVVRGAGGVPVLAHPGQNLGMDEQLVEGVLAEGIDGLEVFSSYHTQAMCDFYRNLARSRGLRMTAGSDFHGRSKPQVCVGEIPWVTDWEEVAAARGFCTP